MSISVDVQRVAAIAFAIVAIGAYGADLQFPSVAVGQLVQAEFTAKTSAGAPLAGVVVSLAVSGGCGQISPTQVTTDISGKGRFNFVAGSQPGVCAITGTSSGVTVGGHTTIFRPEDVVLGSYSQGIWRGPLVDHWLGYQGSNDAFATTVSAGGLPLPLLSVGLGAFSPSGPIVVGPGQITTDSTGVATININAGTEAGVYDLPVTIAGVTRHLRLHQGTMPEQANLADPYRQWLQLSRNPELVTLVDGAAGGCKLGSAQSHIDPLGRLPSGIAEFMQESVEFKLACTSSSVRVRIEYPEPIPADAQVWIFPCVAATGCDFMQTAAEVAGNAVTFTLSRLVNDSIPGYVTAAAGVAVPGAAPAPPTPRVQDLWWAGSSENGWGMTISQAHDLPNLTFAAIFAYDNGGQPTWWVVPGGDWTTSRGAAFTGQAYAPVGTPWFAYEPAITYVGAAVGDAHLHFSDSSHATIDFTLNGVSGHKSIQRQLFGPPASASRLDVGGIWFGGQDQSGWGIAVAQQGDKLFNVWYTYDAANKPTWYVMPDGVWSSATTYQGRIYRTHGSHWLGAVYDPSALQVTDVGSFSISFNTFSGTSGTYSGTFSYTLEGRQGSMPISRQL